MLVLQLPLPSHAADFGTSTIALQRTWSIIGPNGAEFDFVGMLTVNSSNQKVISITTLPPMIVVQDENGSIRLRYNGTIRGNREVLTATAIVLIDYNASPVADPVLVKKTTKGTNLTSYNQAMAAQAATLSVPPSTLNTIRNLTVWVHSAMKYNESYFTHVKNAETVYKERQGVCVEYTHLLLALANALGFESRYVSGYVKSARWQPHAWAEFFLPGYGWLPVDATFNQAGYIDNSHIAIGFGSDQQAVFDSVYSTEDVSFTATNTATFIDSKKDQRGISVACALDNESMLAKFTVENGRNVYAFGNYMLSLPRSIGGQDAGLLLLKPMERRVLGYPLNRSFFQEGFVYTMQLYVSVNDAECNNSFVYYTTQNTAKVQQPVQPQDAQPKKQGCLPGFALAFILLLTIRTNKKIE